MSDFFLYYKGLTSQTTDYRYDVKNRCPWCGNKLPNYLDRNTCPECNNKIKIFSHTKTYMGLLIVFILALLTLLISNIFLPCLITFEIGTILLVAIYKLSIPYRVDDGTSIFKQKAKINIYPNKISDILFPRLAIRKNRIFTLCFVGDDDTPISQMICVFLENIKINDRNVDFTILFLPFGKLDTHFSSGTKFYIFLRETKIGEGKLE